MSLVETVVNWLFVLEVGALFAISALIVYTTVRFRERLMYARPLLSLGAAALLLTTGVLLQSAVHIGGVDVTVLDTAGTGVITVAMAVFTYATYLLGRDVVQLQGASTPVAERAPAPHGGTGFEGGDGDE